MRQVRWVGMVIAGCIVLGLCASVAAADDEATPRGHVPLGQPPAAGQVPVPDVRGVDEARATRILQESGLRVGGVERVPVATLEQQFG
ncbi:MAG: hypothetical protein O2894_09910, partial [Planctomycetota bacterium]|nr:hypothetical protein [Planctomycetota bacterium]